MPTLLRIDSSADVDNSRTRQMTGAVVAGWRARGAEFDVVERDLHAAPPPHLANVDQHWPASLRQYGPLDSPTEERQSRNIGELLLADALVIGVPMYNYSMPSTLKAWVDLIHVPGVTATLGDVVAPLTGRPAILCTARGGAYVAGTPQAGWDHATPPLALVLGQGLGMTVTVVATERTLAERMPDLDVGAARDQLANALKTCERLGSTI